VTIDETLRQLKAERKLAARDERIAKLEEKLRVVTESRDAHEQCLRDIFNDAMTRAEDKERLASHLEGNDNG